MRDDFPEQRIQIPSIDYFLSKCSKCPAERDRNKNVYYASPEGDDFLEINLLARHRGDERSEYLYGQELIDARHEQADDYGQKRIIRF